jgi:hypothetical protein
MAKRYSTSTVRTDGAIVPWLAAEGPLAYSPDSPPKSSYFFQYGWLMPRVYSDKRHYYFRDRSSLSRREVDLGIQPFVDFWAKAQTREFESIYVTDGKRYADGFTAPIACYRYRTGWDNRDTYLLIQHGSYLAVDVTEQPRMQDGLLVLFRGIGRKRKFYWRSLERHTSPDQSTILQRYFDAHLKAFSDAEISFQVAHARVRRCETAFLKWELSWTDVAKEVGFDWKGGSLARWLTSAYQRSFTLLQRTAVWKFGPNHVRCTTPLNNVRITTFFAGESEVRVIDPRKLEIMSPRLGRSTFACEQLHFVSAMSQRARQCARYRASGIASTRDKMSRKS